MSHDPNIKVVLSVWLISGLTFDSDDQLHFDQDNPWVSLDCNICFILSWHIEADYFAKERYVLCSSVFYYAPYFAGTFTDPRTGLSP